MKIVVRVTENGVTGVVRRNFDAVPKRSAVDACVTEALAQINYSCAQDAPKKVVRKKAAKKAD